MADDCALYDEEIQETLDRAQQLLRGDNSGAEQAADLLDRRSKVKTLIHQMKVSTRDLETEAERKVYAGKAQQHSQRLSVLRKDIQQCITAAAAGATSASESDRDGGRSRSRGPYGAVDEPRGDGRDEAHAITKRIGGIQKQTLAHLEHGLLVVNKAEEEANDAAQRLAQQTAQMEENNKNLDHIDGQVKKARSELNAFIRRMMTDKIILCLAILVVVGIIAVVAVKLSGVDKDDKSTAPTPTPATASPTVGQSAGHAFAGQARHHARSFIKTSSANGKVGGLRGVPPLPPAVSTSVASLHRRS